MASERLHLHICEQLRDLVEILQDPSPPPICLPHDTRAGSADPNQVSSTEDHGEVPNDAVPRFHLEKAVSHESLVIGAIENAFKHMVRILCLWDHLGHPWEHLFAVCLHQLDPTGKRQLCSKEGMAERAPSLVISERVL